MKKAFEFFVIYIILHFLESNIFDLTKKIAYQDFLEYFICHLTNIILQTHKDLNPCEKDSVMF